MNRIIYQQMLEWMKHCYYYKGLEKEKVCRRCQRAELYLEEWNNNMIIFLTIFAGFLRPYGLKNTDIYVAI